MTLKTFCTVIRYNTSGSLAIIFLSKIHLILVQTKILNALGVLFLLYTIIYLKVIRNYIITVVVGYYSKIGRDTYRAL